MSQQLTLELSDEVYAELQQQAQAVGLSVTEWVVTVLSDRNSGVSKVLHSTAQEEARQRFRSHAGAISLGYPTGINNESIEADLAKAYASEYEG